MFESAGQTIFVLIGIPASGKTTFCRQYFANAEIISLDVLKTRKKEDRRLCEVLNSGQNAVIDNTNVTKDERKKYITAAKENNCKIVGIYFRSAVDGALKRNELRAGKVPVKAILAKAKQLEKPSYEEGFDELYYARIAGDRFLIDRWKENNEI